MSDDVPTEAHDGDAPLPGDGDDESLHYFCRLTFGQFFTLVVLLVITVCATFYLGARYGNDYLRLDGTPQHETAQLPPPPAAPTITPAQQAAIQNDELKRLARQALQREQQQQLEQQVEAYLNAPVPTQPPAGQQVPPLAMPAAPAPVQAPPEAPPHIAGDAGFPYAVQLGAYRNYDEATAHLDNWKTKGYPAYLLSADLPESGRWYRVRVGAFATRVEAQSFQEEFGRRESLEGIVVRNE